MTKIILMLLALLPALGCAQDVGKQRLEKSPRHQEWVEVKRGDRTVHCFVVYPQTDALVPVIVVIHENSGLTDWVRAVADQLAEAGYIAIAPDLLSGAAPGGGRTKDFPDAGGARQAIYALEPTQVTADLNAVSDYAAKLPSSNRKVAVAGFCWGGAQAFRFATNRQSLSAAYVFYGTGPEDESAVRKISCPVYGFYGGNDARVNATVPATAELMRKAGKSFEPVTYEGAGHGFMRSGEAPDASEENKKARGEAWKRWKELLSKLASS